MEYLNNQWIVGIGTSIISGLIVFFITRKFFTVKQSREYGQKIRTANNEILYAIRPIIVEKTELNIKILNSILESISRKYNVALADIYDRDSLCDDLINEIMTNSFLSSQQKMNLTTMIINFKEDRMHRPEPDIEHVNRGKSTKSYTSSNFIATAMSMMATLYALAFTLYGSVNKNSVIGTELEPKRYIVVIMSALLVPLFTLFMVYLIKINQKKKRSESQRRSIVIQNNPIFHKEDK